jgi:phage gpG-like protein
MSTSLSDLISQELRAKIAKLQDRRPVLSAAGAALASQAQRAFRDAALRPAPWALLAASTLKRKKGKGNTLIDTGALWQSILAGAPTESSVSVVSDRPYAAFLQDGTRKMPARPFFPFSASGEITPAAATSVENAMRAAVDALLESGKK